MPSAPWWQDLTEAERLEAYEGALENWHERYAEAGSGWVFGGGNPADANLAASEVAGPQPNRADYGLPPLPETSPVVALRMGHEVRADDFDDDLPF